MEESQVVLLSLDDEVFFECMLELGIFLRSGWYAESIENDQATNSTWLTFTRKLPKAG